MLSKFLRAAERGDVGLVRRMIEGSPDLVAARSEDGDTALHLTAWQGHIDCSELLLEAGADVDARGDCDRTPLHYALEHENFEIVRLLVKAGANVRLADEWRRTPLEIAAAHSDELLAILRGPDQSGRPADTDAHATIAKAVRTGDAEAIRRVCEERILVELRDKLTEQLGLAIALVDSVLLEGLFSTVNPEHLSVRLDVVRALISGGADPNGPSGAGQKPVLSAAQIADPQVLEMLVNSGARLDFTSSVGTSVASLVSRNPARDLFYAKFPQLRRRQDQG